MARKKSGQIQISRELLRWANHEVDVHAKMVEKQKWCAEHKHPEAKSGNGKDAPRDHLYCRRCNVIFYDTKHPAYIKAKRIGYFEGED